jgi:sugar lactone lactonase YvrE
MIHRVYLLVAFICLAILVPPVAQPYAASPIIARPHATQSSANLVPLPSRCPIGLPPGSDEAVCCMFGYVLIDGQAVAGAQVNITSPHGSMAVWTEQQPDTTQPYYRVNLSAAPLSVRPGDTLTVDVTYSGHHAAKTYRVQSGGQQLDLTLGRNQADDYVFDRRLWQPDAPGKFNAPNGIAIDGSGTVYVVDSGNARVQVFNSSGQFLRQWGSLGGQPGEFARPSAIAVDRRGNVYVTEFDNHRVQKFSTTGEVSTWGSEGSSFGQFHFPTGVAVDSAGNVYVTEWGNARIQKFSAEGTYLLSFGRPGSAPGQLNQPTGIALDSSGNLYVADTGNNRIQKFKSNGVYERSWGGTGANQLKQPIGIAVSGGSVYVTDTGNYRVQKFTTTGSFQAIWGGEGQALTQFASPEGIAVAPSGRVYVADSRTDRFQNDRVIQFSSDGALVQSWGGTGGSIGTFAEPHGIAASSNNTLFIADAVNHRIQQMRADGTPLGYWGGRGSRPGEFNFPKDVALDRSGNVYVADTGNQRVQQFRSDGTYIRSWNGSGTEDGRFADPSGIAVDQQGNIYVADTGRDRIQKFGSDGTFITSWGGSGTGHGQFDFPFGLTVDAGGSLYVADTNNHRVQKFSSQGSFLAAWGGFGDTNGQFYKPIDVTTDAAGNLYVVDNGNSRVQKLRPDGAWLSGFGDRGSADGELIYPLGVAATPNGEIVVSDANVNRLQVFRVMTYAAPTAAIISATPRDVVAGDTIILRGSGSDSDETPGIAGYEWTLDGGVPFATSANAQLSTAGLSGGVHTIAFRVRDDEHVYSPPQIISISVSAADPTKSPTAWTMLLYLDGDAPGLAAYLDRNSPLGALYRLEHTAPNSKVRVVALYDGYRAGGGDSYRYVQQDDGTFTAEALGEVNMGDPQTLVDFVRWGRQVAPADQYYLAIADHANAIDGIAWDFTSGATEHLTNTELRQALAGITENGALPLDVLHLDGCLMGLVENAYQARGMAHTLVASENLAWSSFAYEAYRAAITPATNAATFATTIVDRYSAQVGAAGYPYTIAALDLSKINDLEIKTDALAQELLRFALAGSTQRGVLANLRAQAQTLDSNADLVLNLQDEYIDLDHWAQLVQSGVSDNAVRNAAAAVRSARAAVVLRDRHASGTYEHRRMDLSEARGVGIYYPTQHTARIYGAYRRDFTFTADTQWDEFLAAALAERSFAAAEPAPRPIAPLRMTPPVFVPIVGR